MSTRLLTTREVAEMLHVSRKTVHNMGARGELRKVQLGGRRRAVRWRESDVTAYLRDASYTVYTD